MILDSSPVLAGLTQYCFTNRAKNDTGGQVGEYTPAVARRAAVQLLESACAEVAALLVHGDTKRAAKNGDPMAKVHK
jgi:hypothetical protein